MTATMDVLAALDEVIAVSEAIANGYWRNPEHERLAGRVRNARRSVAALIAERDALKRMLEQSEQDVFKQGAEIDVLRADAERYRMMFSMPSAADGGLHFIVPGKYGLTSTKDKAVVDPLIDSWCAENNEDGH